MVERIDGNRYFRCETYSQTIRVAACRTFRKLAGHRTVRIGYFTRTKGACLHPRCKDCLRAQLLEAGRLTTWPLNQLLEMRGQAGSAAVQSAPGD